MADKQKINVPDELMKIRVAAKAEALKAGATVEQAALAGYAAMLAAHEAKVRADERRKIAEKARKSADTFANNRPPMPADAATLRWFADRITAADKVEEASRVD